MPLEVRGSGFLDCHVYQQTGRLILHIVNLTSINAWRAPIDELIPVGPLEVKVRMPQGFKPRSARLLVSGTTAPATIAAGWATLTIPTLTDHEVAVLS